MAWRCIRLDYNAEQYIYTVTNVGGWQLAQVVPYLRIPFGIKYGISVLRLLWVQFNGGGI
jgi:hypothetical protein